MIKAEIKYDTVEIDPKELTEEQFAKTAERAMLDVLGFHQKNYKQGLGVDGSRRKLSKEYTEQKSKAGRNPINDFYFSGKLLLSISTRAIKWGVETIFEGDHPVRGTDKKTGKLKLSGSQKTVSNAEIAEGLQKRGFKFHFFTKKNIDYVHSFFEKDASKKLNDAIKEKKRT